jgi:hypothetical protein
MLSSGVHESLQNNNSSKSHSSHHHKERDYANNYSKEREGRKSQIRGLGSKPASRANSKSRTGTPLPPVSAGVEAVAPTSQAASFAAAQIQQLHHAQSAVPSIPSSTASSTTNGNTTSTSSSATTSPSLNTVSRHPTPVSTPSLTPTPAQIQAQAHLVSAYPYQQRFLEHQRAQYAAQMQQQTQAQVQAQGDFTV